MASRQQVPRAENPALRNDNSPSIHPLRNPALSQYSVILINDMANRTIKKTISLPRELARELQEQARAEQKTLSGVILEALWISRRARLTRQLEELQGYWSEKAKQKGILTDENLERYLRH